MGSGREEGERGGWWFVKVQLEVASEVASLRLAGGGGGRGRWRRGGSM